MLEDALSRLSEFYQVRIPLSLRDHSFEKIVEEYSRKIQLALVNYGISDIVVERKPIRKEIDVSDKLTLGIMGGFPNDVAKFISAQGAHYEGMPILTVLVPYQLEGSILVDSEYQVAATDFVYYYEEGKISPVYPKKLLFLDAIERINSPNDTQEIPESAVLNGKTCIKITADKLLTKQILREKGFNVPSYQIISWKNLKNLKLMVREFSGDFVIKATTGGAGNGVKLFDRRSIQEAEKFAEYLLGCGKKVYVEERVEPKEWCDNHGRLFDWNIRSIVTFSENPQFVEGEIRYHPRNYDPVNVSRGSNAEQLEHILAKLDIPIEEIKDTSVQVAKAVHSECKTVFCGHLGLDFIVNDKVHVLEANSNPGGFATLMKLRQKQLQSVRDILLPAYGSQMMKNYSKRKDNLSIQEASNRGFVLEKLFSKEKTRFKRAPLSASDALVLAIKYIKIDDKNRAFLSLKQAWEQNPDDPRTCYYLGIVLRYTGFVQESIKFHKQAIKCDPKFYFSYTELGNIYRYYDDYPKAISAFENSVKLNPVDAGPYITLCRIHIKNGNYGAAFKQACKGYRVIGKEIIGLLKELKPSFWPFKPDL